MKKWREKIKKEETRRRFWRQRDSRLCIVSFVTLIWRWNSRMRPNKMRSSFLIGLSIYSFGYSFYSFNSFLKRNTERRREERAKPYSSKCHHHHFQNRRRYNFLMVFSLSLSLAFEGKKRKRALIVRSVLIKAPPGHNNDLIWVLHFSLSLSVGRAFRGPLAARDRESVSELYVRGMCPSHFFFPPYISTCGVYNKCVEDGRRESHQTAIITLDKRGQLSAASSLHTREA